MAKSLDQLIDFLLEEIALSGGQGVVFRDVVDFTNQFYAQPRSSSEASSRSKHTSSFLIDRNFIAKLWKWLARHENISIGHEKEYNNLEFQEFEARFPGIIEVSLSRTLPLPELGTGAGHDLADSGQPAALLCHNDGPRITVSLERIYLAICGHRPDPTRVFPMEYALLGAIAATRHNGILQGELGRSTGQDKRSVPKRTDALQAKGYIVKRSVWTGGHKTSRLILRRFADQTDPSSAQDRRTYTLQDLARQVLATLTQNSFTTQDDLAMALSMTDPARQRILSQVIRYLVQKKCLKKVRIAKGPASGSHDLKICIQIVRDPVESDWQKSDEDILNLETSVDDALTAVRMELASNDDDATVAAVDDDDAHASAHYPPGPSSATRPSWNPDRLLPNILRDLATVAGEEGVTNVTARRDITGLPVRRPIESLLVRLSHGSLNAQPPQIRDLSLVRSSEVKDSVSRFVYRTLGNYQSLVQQGQGDWSNLSGGKQVAERLQSAQTNDLMGGFDKDEFGFFKWSTSKSQIPYGQVDLEDLANMTKAAALTVRSNEPILVDDLAGNVSLAWMVEGSNDVRSSRSATPIKLPPKRKALAPPTYGGNGRRRKFTKGTEKFWREMFLAKMILENPSYPRHGVTGMMNDPACLEMFNTRPPDLDAMVVKVSEQNLPVPLSLETVTQAWIDRMNAFFDRRTPGVYFAPSGAQNMSRRQLSCIVVVRSNRLGTINFSDRTSPASVLFFPSSAAHTYRYYRNDARVTLWQLQEATKSSKQPTRQGAVKSAVQAPQPRSKKSSKPKSRPEPTPEPRPPLSHEPVTERMISPDVTPRRGYAPQKGASMEHMPPVPPMTTTMEADIQKRRRNPSKTNSLEQDSDATASESEMPSRIFRPAQRKDGRDKVDAQFSHSSMVQTERADSPVSVWGLPERRWSYNTAAAEPDEHRIPASPDDYASFTKRTVLHSVRNRPLQVSHADSLLTHSPFRGNGERENSTSAMTASSPATAQRLAAVSAASERAETTSSSLTATDTSGALHRDLFLLSPTQKGDLSTGHKGPVCEGVPSPLSPQTSSKYHVASSNPEDASEVANGSPPHAFNPPDSAHKEQEKVASKSFENAVFPPRTSSLESSTAVHSSNASETVPRASPDASNVCQVGPNNNAPTVCRMEPSAAEPMIQRRVDSENCAASPVSHIRRPKSKPRAEASQPRTAQILEGRDATKYYQSFILELIKMCGGVLPHGPGGPPMLKRAMKAKCIEAGVDSNPNIKQVKSSINQLIQRGSAKLMHFAFQKSGFNHTKAVLALPHIQPTDGQLIAMQGKIKSMPGEDDYVPPEVEAEADRKPLGMIRRDLDSDSERDAAITPQRKKRQGQPRRRRQSSTPSISRHISLAPIAPEPSPNVGFLTLKVPNIATVKTHSTFTTKYFELPAEPLQFNTDANVIATQTAEPTTASQRRSGIRVPRDTKFNSQTRKIQWRVPKTTPLPKSLKAILTQDRRTDAEAALGDQAALSAFVRAVDFVVIWEQRKYEDLQEQKPGTWNFINHLLPKNDFTALPREGELEFRMVQFRGTQDDAADHEEIESVMPVAVSWDVFAQISSTTRAKQMRATVATEKRKRKLNEIDGVDGDREDSDFGVSAGEEPRSQRARRQPKTPKIKKRKAGTEDDVRKRKHPRLEPRGIGMRHLSQDQAHRMGIIFAVVKVLAGGLDRYLDFKLVARLVPEESESVVRERWKVLATRYNNDIDALIQDVQIKYLDALADDRVPSVNFDNPGSTNWEGILAWANTNVNTKDKDLFRDLPPTREEFLTLNNVEVAEPPPVRNLYNVSLNYTQGSKEEAWCSAVLGTVPTTLPQPDGDHLTPRFPHEENEKDTELARARSWVTAAILTPEHKFNPAHAHQKLLKLAENPRTVDNLLEITMKKLQSDRVVIEKKSNESVSLPDGSRLSGTHGWKVSAKYFDKYDSNRVITAHMLRGAANYKLYVLDVAFARGETVLLSKEPNMEDGEMMAIFNLVSMGMLQVRPGRDVPASRYGLDWEDQGYKTKSMDKNILSFSTILEPTSSYSQGDPLTTSRSSVPVPRGGIDQSDGLGLIPAWFDINHDFQPYVWEMVVGAVVGIISVRPGISKVEIVRSLGWVLSQHDLDLILQFLLGCTLIQRTYNGWETTEWWWLALGAGYSNGVRWKTTHEIRGISSCE